MLNNMDCIALIITCTAVLVVLLTAFFMWFRQQPKIKRGLIIKDAENELKSIIHAEVEKLKQDYNSEQGQTIKNMIVSIVLNSPWYVALKPLAQNFVSVELIEKWVDMAVNNLFSDLSNVTQLKTNVNSSTQVNNENQLVKDICAQLQLN